MKRSLAIALVLLAALGLFACEESDDNPSKGDLCKDLMGAYCDQLGKLNCPEASGCKDTQNAYCAQLFAKDCEATENEVDTIRNHHIPFWIEDKESCDAVTGLESILVMEAHDLKSTACADGSSLDGGDSVPDGDDPDGDDPDTGTWASVGEMCSAVLGEVCRRIIALECADITQADCVAALFADGTIPLGDVSCSDPDDSRAPSANAQAEADLAIAESQAATACSQFGF